LVPQRNHLSALDDTDPIPIPFDFPIPVIAGWNLVNSIDGDTIHFPDEPRFFPGQLIEGNLCFGQFRPARFSWHALDELRCETRRVLLPERFPMNVIRKALQCKRALRQVRQERGRKLVVYLDEVFRRESGPRNSKRPPMFSRDAERTGGVESANLRL
jgi:hypothetical protein